jgi:tetratricopeptide (TPR) repeat protein
MPDGPDPAWRRLRRHIEWSDVGGFAFVVAPGPTAAILRDQARWQLQARGRVLVTFAPQTPKQLSAALPEIERAAHDNSSVWVEQTAADPASLPEGPWLRAWQELLRALNHRRDSLRAKLAHGTLYLVGSRAVLEAAKSHAPDVWSVRALVVDATGPALDGLESRHEVLLDPRASEPFDLASRIAGTVVGEPAPLGPELASLLRAAEAALGDDRAAEAIERLDQVIARAQLDATRGLALILRAAARRESGDFGAGLSDGIAALALLPRVDRTWLRWVGFVATAAGDAGDLELATRLRTQAVEFAEGLARSASSTAASRDLAVALAELGYLQRADGNVEEAVSNYARALEIHRALAEADPAPAALRDLAVTLNRLGEVQATRGDLDSALASSASAVEILRELEARASGPESRRDLAIALNTIGIVHLGRGDLDAALADFTQSLEIRERLAGTEASPRAQRDLSITQSNVGNVEYRRRNFHSARDHYLRALETAERLRADHPTIEAMRDLLVVLRNLGTTQRALRDVDAALLNGRRSVELSRELLAVNPTPRTLTGLAMSLENLARAHRAQGDASAAEPLEAEARAVRDGLA